MIRKYLLGIGAALAVVASPAAAQTFNLGQASANGQTQFTSPSQGGLTLTTAGYSFIDAPLSLTNMSQLSSGATLSVSSLGVGVCTAGESSAECSQVDTNGPAVGTTNEALLLSFTGAANVSLLGAVLNMVDRDDTLRIYGVNAVTGALTALGYNDSAIWNGGTGFSGSYNSTLNGGTYSMAFTPALQGYSSYLFTSNRDSNDGYRLSTLTVSAVPELEVWAMLILGFGLIGFQMRRRSGLATVTA